MSRRVHFVGVIALWGAMAVIAAVVSGCATGPKYGPDSPVTTVVVPVEPLKYPPLVPKLPITVGIYYTPELRAASVQTGGGSRPRVAYLVGPSAVACFEQVAASLFARTVELQARPQPGQRFPVVDLAFVLDYQPARYDANLVVEAFATDGSTIATNGSYIQLPLTTAADAPLESYATPNVGWHMVVDGVADLAVGFLLSREAAAWVANHDIAWNWSGDAASRVVAPSRAGVAVLMCPRLTNCHSNEASQAISAALRKLDPKVYVVEANTVLDAFYPWMRSATSNEDLPDSWMRRSIVAARAEAIGLRYLVLADLLGTSTHEHGGIVGAGGFGGGGFFGLMWWTRKEFGRLDVFDFVDAVNAGTVRHENEFVTLALPALLIPVPIPMPNVGESMSEAIARQLLPMVRPHAEAR
jgi:hypothetical protein